MPSVSELCCFLINEKTTSQAFQSYGNLTTNADTQTKIMERLFLEEQICLLPFSDEFDP